MSTRFKVMTNKRNNQLMIVLSRKKLNLKKKKKLKFIDLEIKKVIEE